MPKGLQKVKFTFEAKGLTRFGGLMLFQQFCKSLGLRRFLQTYIQWSTHGQKKYHPADLFLTHLFAVVAGIGRIQNTQSLIHNGLLPSLLGLPNFPHRDTLRDFLGKFTLTSLKSLQLAHDKIRQNLFGRLGPIYSSIIDIDTTVLTVYGHQQGSAIGYNPFHRGKKSFCPILSSEGKLGLTLNFELRPGNVHPSPGAVPFLKQTLEELPKTVASTRTRIRADASFYDKNLIQFLDDNRLGYVIIAKLTGPIKKILPSISYHPFQRNWEAGEFSYQPHFWEKEHRFIAIRSLIKETEFPVTLFTMKDFSYRVLVTNLNLRPEIVWRLYCARGLQELLIRELKSNYALAKIPSRSFIANQVYLEIVLWAYDLVMAFKYLCLPQDCQAWTISTLRRNLWQLPAEWVRPDNKNLLRLPLRFPYQDVFRSVERTITRIKPLI
jgi:hypothetical protein